MTTSDSNSSNEQLTQNLNPLEAPPEILSTLYRLASEFDLVDEKHDHVYNVREDPDSGDPNTFIRLKIDSINYFTVMCLLEIYSPPTNTSRATHPPICIPDIENYLNHKVLDHFKSFFGGRWRDRQVEACSPTANGELLWVITKNVAMAQFGFEWILAVSSCCISLTRIDVRRTGARFRSNRMPSAGSKKTSKSLISK